MQIVSRAAWGAQGGQGQPLTGPLEYVVVHHTAGPWSYAGPVEEAAAVRGIERTHMSARNFDGIGYSWLLSPSGRVFEGRGWLHEGAHTVGWNDRAHGLAFMGDGTTRPATPEQWSSARWLIGEGIRAGAVTHSPLVSGHRDHDATACPGRLIYAELDRLRDITGEEDDMPSEEFFESWFRWLGDVIKGQTGARYNQANTHHGEAMEVRWRAVNLTGAEGELLAKMQDALDQHTQLMARHVELSERMVELTCQAAPVGPEGDPGATQVLPADRP